MKRADGGWMSDWTAFVERVGQSFDRGLDNVAVTHIFAGHPVRWKGRVAEVDLGDELPGVQLDMPPVEVAMSDGRRTTVDYLFLHLNEDDLSTWRHTKIGDLVSFVTRIGTSNGPFPGVRWSSDVLLFSTEGGRRVED